MKRKTIIWILGGILVTLTIACNKDLKEKIDDLAEQVAQLQNSFNQQKEDLLTEMQQIKAQNDLNEKELEKLDGIISSLQNLDHRTKSDSIQLVELKKELNRTKINLDNLQRITHTYFGDVVITDENEIKKYTNYYYFWHNLTIEGSSIKGNVRFPYLQTVLGTTIIRNTEIENVQDVLPSLTSTGELCLTNNLRLRRILLTNNHTIECKSKLEITSNPWFIDLIGLGGDLKPNIFIIKDNPTLRNFCYLNTILNDNVPSIWDVSGNAYNPRADQVKNGQCVKYN